MTAVTPDSAIAAASFRVSHDGNPFEPPFDKHVENSLLLNENEAMRVEIEALRRRVAALEARLDR